MKCKKLKLGFILLLILKLTGVMAQEAVLTSGMGIIGTGGSVSYSVGQVAYMSEEGSSGSLTQGIQQCYEISIITGIDNKKIDLEISAFPNPTNNNLILTIDNMEFSNLSFQLFNAAGKFLQKKKILNTQTTVDLSNYSSGIYFVKILRGSVELKNFKIIKK